MSQVETEHKKKKEYHKNKAILKDKVKEYVDAKDIKTQDMQDYIWARWQREGIVDLSEEEE